MNITRSILLSEKHVVDANWIFLVLAALVISGAKFGDTTSLIMRAGEELNM